MVQRAARTLLCMDRHRTYGERFAAAIASAGKDAHGIAAALGLLWVGPALANMACGLPPLPPLGCKVGPCVCDKNGQNCQYTFVCS